MMFLVIWVIFKFHVIFQGCKFSVFFYRMTCIFIWPFLFATMWSIKHIEAQLGGWEVGRFIKVATPKATPFPMFHLERIAYERDHEPPFTHPAPPFQHDIRHFHYHICSWGIHSTAFGSMDICQIGLRPVRGLSPCEMQLKGLFSYQKNDLFVEEYVLCSLFHYRFPWNLATNTSQSEILEFKEISLSSQKMT